EIEEEEHEPEVGRAQDVSRDDRVGRVQVVQRHRDRHHGHEDGGLAGEAADRALLLLHELLGLPPGLLVDDDVLRNGWLCGRRGGHEGRAGRTSRWPCSPRSRKGRSVPPARRRWGVPAAMRKTISVMVRAMACRSPAEVMPKYSRTAALGLVTARRTICPSSSTTKS